MLKIRLQRIGRKKRPSYSIVVAEHSQAVQGRSVERIGFYDPIVKPKVFEIDQDKLMEWIGKGAQPSSTVARLLKGSGVKGMERYIEQMVDKKKKNQSDEEPKEETPVEEAAPEAPAEEPKEEVKEEEAPAEDPVEAPVEEKVEEAPVEDPVEAPVEEKVEEAPVETPTEEPKEEVKGEEAPTEEEK